MAFPFLQSVMAVLKAQGGLARSMYHLGNYSSTTDWFASKIRHGVGSLDVMKRRRESCSTKGRKLLSGARPLRRHENDAITVGNVLYGELSSLCSSTHPTASHTKCHLSSDQLHERCLKPPALRSSSLWRPGRGRLLSCSSAR